MTNTETILFILAALAAGTILFGLYLGVLLGSFVSGAGSHIGSMKSKANRDYPN